MAQTYYVLDRRGFQSTIAGVNHIDEEDVIDYYTSENHRDDPTGLLGGAANVEVSTGSLAPAVYVGYSKSLDPLASASPTPAAFASDLITHTAPRQTKSSQTRLVFYSGKTQTQTLTTVSATDQLQTISAEYMSVGQGVAGTGIPVGTTIKAISATGMLTLSALMTASASVVVTFDLGRRLATVWLTAHVHVGIAPFTRVT